MAKAAKTKKKTAKKKAKAKGFTARGADRHVLYQMSVQNPDQEVEFVSRTFKRLRGRRAMTLREDFCGTAIVSAYWAKSDERRTATGIDLDADVLEWGRTHNVEPLGEEAAARVTLLCENVLDAGTETYDAVSAMNFSYFLFRTRRELVDYFRVVHAALVPDGVFFLDAYGGYEAQQVMEEPRKIDGGFTYVWDQAAFNPIDNGAVNYIHFRFKDGTSIERAFSYPWRLWSLPEIQEALLDAGFTAARVYWEDDDEDGIYRVRKRVENQAGWVCFLTGIK